MSLNNDPNLELLIKCDETDWTQNAVIADSSVNGLDGYCYGANLASAAGKFGNAYQGNATVGQFIQGDNDTALDFTTEDFTIAFWATLGGTATEWLFARATAYNGTGYAVRWLTSNSGQLEFHTYGVTNHVSYISNMDSYSGTFHHFAFVRVGTTVTLYIDGVATSWTSSGTHADPSTTSVTWKIGALTTGVGFYAGKMDDVRIYSRALSASEIRALSNPYGMGLNDDPNLGAHFQLDGDLVDDSSLGADGSLVGLAGTYGPGKFGQSLLFDGIAGHYVQCTNDSSLNFISEDFTLACWSKPDVAADGNSYQWLIDRSEYNVSGYGMMYRPTALYSYLYTHQSGVIQTSRVAIPSSFQGTWNHIAWVRTGASAKCYLNGVDTALDLAGTHIDPATCAKYLKLGSNTTTGAQTFDGYINDARVYSRALTVSEIRQLVYNPYIKTKEKKLRLLGV